MTVTLLLLAHAALLATAGPALLRRATWPWRAPRLGIAAWHALSVSVIGSALLAGATVAVSAARGGAVPRPCDAPARWTCSPVTAPAGTALALAAAVVTLAVAVRAVGHLTAAYVAARRERRRQDDALAVLGRADDRLGVTVVDHATPAAYCLPGRGGRIVVTTAALAVLDDDQLAAVLAHERAHLRQCHHVIRTAARGLAQAFPRVPAFAAARDQISQLTELAADDAAAGHCGRLTIAGALLALAEAGPAVAPALTAGGTTSAARARRLIAGERPPGHARLMLGLAVAALVVSVPVAVPVAAAVASTPPSATCCTTALQAR
jgi:Zn-dependent protease with chaperone function